MIAAWMLYSVAVSAVLGVCALALEHAVRRSGMPVRWLWAGALLASLVVSALPWLRSREERRLVPAPVWIGADVAPERPVAMPVYVPAPKLDVPVEPGLLSRLEGADRPLLALWAVAAAMGVLYLLGTHRTLARRRRLWRRSTVDGVPALVSRDVGPAVVGFLDAAIVVPGWVLGMEPEERRLVLAHEEEHLRAGDVRLLSLALIAVAIAPWNAALWWQLRRLRHAVELDCDARVLDGEGDAERYCDLLIEVGARASMRGVAFAAFAESRSMLERRIMSMIGPRPRRWAAPVGICVALAGLAFVYACEAPLPTLPPADVAADVEESELAIAAPEPVAVAAEETVMLDVLVAEPVAVPEARMGRREEVSGRDVIELVRRRYPELYARGLPPEQTVWLAIDHDGQIVKSWIGQNIYLPFEHYRPMREYAFPEGSPERARAVAEHERLQQAILDANVPGMRAHGIFAAYYYAPPGDFGVHIVTETPSPIPPGRRVGVASADLVNRAVRAELER